MVVSVWSVSMLYSQWHIVIHYYGHIDTAAFYCSGCWAERTPLN